MLRNITKKNNKKEKYEKNEIKNFKNIETGKLLKVEYVVKGNNNDRNIMHICI